METGHDIELDITALSHSQSAKWTRYGPGVLPLWVADMDFAIAPSIRAALVERAQRSIGYHLFDDPPLVQLIAEKMERMGFAAIPEKGISFLSGVVQGLYASVVGLTAPGDDVLTMTPIYPPFLSAITNHGRNTRLAPLMATAEGCKIDWNAMEAAVTPATRLLMLCHPHNPTGRVWNAEELKQLSDFAERHRLWVVSDELHADLTLDGPFIPFVAVAPQDLQMRTVTLTGPCKTYNTAGLGIGAMISHNPELIARLKKAVQGIAGHPNTMSHTMWLAALRDDGMWLAGVLDRLRANRAFLQQFITEHLPAVGFCPPQATYLSWLDFRRQCDAPDVQKFLLDRAKVALNAGPEFGPGNEGFVRLNFATSPVILREALERIAGAFK